VANSGKNTKNLAIIFAIDDFFTKLLALLQKNAYLCTRTLADCPNGTKCFELLYVLWLQRKPAGAIFVGKQ
jgi:hypothetical protein